MIGGRASDLTEDGILWPNRVVRTNSVKEIPSMIRITLSAQTRKSVASRLQQAYAAHATRLVRRIHALLWLIDGKPVGEIVQTLDPSLALRAGSR